MTLHQWNNYMHLRASFCLTLLVSLWGSACTTATAAEPNIAPLASATTAVAPVVQSWQTLVTSLALHPEVLTQNWAGVRRVLPAGCFQNAGSRDLNCPPLEGVVRVSVDPGPAGMIDVVLKAPADCDQIYALMSRHLGKGALENNDKCSAEWSLKRWVKRASANLSKGRKDPSQLYLQFAVEQGP
ncbi:MAG: hypothetical protein ACOYNB_01025 [Aquabacterium sp.]|uniref:hypothetical protein n=1 Tax=Aquabacterium sp. TaxID=1872578 RepID=UPI003BCBC005